MAGFALLRTMADNWWLVLLRGIAAIAFGILAFVWPVITLADTDTLWGAYAVADGLLRCGCCRRPARPHGRALLAHHRRHCRRRLQACSLSPWPGITALVLLFFIAIWAIVIGLMQIWGAIQLRKEIEGEWLLILSGLLSVAFGVLLLVRPGLGALAVVWMIGLVCDPAKAVSLVAPSLRLRKHWAPGVIRRFSFKRFICERPRLPLMRRPSARRELCPARMRMAETVAALFR